MDDKQIYNRNNYLAFSVWGNKEIYTIGAIKNAVLAKSVYPDWKPVFFYDKSVPQAIINKLSELPVLLIDMTNSPIYPPFWRFLAADFADCQYAVFRDTDSRISQREYLAVQEWIKSDEAIHLMRDHPYHQIPHGSTTMSMLAGMWGIKGGIVKMEELIMDFCKNREDQYGIDQAFLDDLHQKFQHSKVVHDEFFEKRKFPVPRKSFRFIGERVDENEQPVGNDWLAVKRFYKEHPTSVIGKIKKSIRKLFKFKKS